MHNFLINDTDKPFAAITLAIYPEAIVITKLHSDGITLKIHPLLWGNVP